MLLFISKSLRFRPTEANTDGSEPVEAGVCFTSPKGKQFNTDHQPQEQVGGRHTPTDEILPVISPGILQGFLDSCDAFRNLSALSAVSCSRRLFLHGSISPPTNVSFIFTSFSAFLLQVRTRSIRLCS